MVKKLTVSFQFHYFENLLVLLPLKLLKHSLQMFSSLFRQKYLKMRTQLIQLKSLCELYFAELQEMKLRGSAIFSV